MNSQAERGSGERPRIDVPRTSAAGFVALAIVSWIYIVSGDSGLWELFTVETWKEAGDFLRRLVGLETDGTSAFLDAASWKKALRLSVETLAMSVLAAGIAGAAALLTFLPGARNVGFGQSGGARSRVGVAAFFVTRGAFAFTRSVPELVWALLIVFVLSPGVLAAALALAIHNYGILGKLSAEVVENLDPRPARALRAAGAGWGQTLLYALLPQVLPQFITYLLYRWEVIIRTTVVVGFVAAGGLGREFRLNMSFLHYDDVGLLLLCYLFLVVGVDLASAGLRRLAR
ncbi:MAG: ABC transporter permease subunit [Chloroflexi bacterium]|nr:ABC transporter permease subunit [Chloroflexota bacterium]